MSDRPPAHPLPDHRSNRRQQGRAVRIAVTPLVLSWLLGAQLIWPAPAVARDVPVAAPADAAAPEATGVQPGIQYEDAVAHEHDRIEFEPGGRVTVGFRPRAGDGWEIDGRAPRALPAGTVSGRELLGDTAGDDPAVAGRRPRRDVRAGADPGRQPLARCGLRRAIDRSVRDPGRRRGHRASACHRRSPRPRRHPPPPAGLRLPPVLGGERRGPRLRGPLDDRLLQRRQRRRTGNLLKRNTDGSTTTGWSGWTSSRDDLDHQRRPPERDPGRPDDHDVRLDERAGRRPGRAARQRDRPAQPREAGRGRRPGPRCRRDQPRLRADRVRLRRRVHRVRQDRPRRAQQAGAPGYQLTFDTTGYIGNYPIEAATASGAADAVFIMGYDYRTSSSPSAGSIDPLAGPAYDLADTVNAFTARIAPSKVILGLPWYGRAWSTVSDAVNAKSQSGTKYGASAAVNYSTAVDYAAKYGRRWDSRELSSWVAYRRENCTTTYGCVTSWRQIYYDDATAMKLRFDLINRKGLRGAGIWALGYDGSRPELRQAIAEKFLNDRTAPLAGIRTLPPSQDSERVSVSWTGSDESGIRDYDVQVSINGGAWSDWLYDATATSAFYTGADGYGFAFRVRARDTHGNVGAWDVSNVYTSHPALAPGGFGRVVVDSLNVRSAASTSSTVLTTVDAGTILAITGGPVSAEGYAWFKVTLPIEEWAPVAGVTTDVWVAASSSTSTRVVAAPPPNTTLVNLPAGTAPAAGARFVGLSPVRLLDTRVGNGLSGAFTSGAARTVVIGGRGGVPSDAVAVALTATVTGQTSAGYLSLGPSTATVGRSSVINTPRGDVRAVGIMAKLASNGSLAAMWTGAGGSKAHVVLDVTGYFVAGSSGATYVPVAPARILDSRINVGATGAFVADTPRKFAVTGHGGVPDGAVAVTGNLVAVAPPSSGYASLGPTASSAPTSSTLNVPRGDIRGTSVTVGLDDAGRLGLVWKGATGSRAHFVFDVTGYFVNSGSGRTYYPIDPARVVDSRVANGLGAVLPANLERGFQAAGRGTIPVDAAAVTGGLTIVSPSAAGWLSVGPTAAAVGTVSILNAPRGDIRSNGVAVPVGSLGRMLAEFHAANGTSTHLILDLTGYFR